MFGVQRNILFIGTFGDKSLCLSRPLVVCWRCKTVFKGALKNGLSEASGALETGGNNRFLFLDHAQSPLHFGRDALLLNEWREGNRQGEEVFCVNRRDIRRGFLY